MLSYKDQMRPKENQPQQQRKPVDPPLDAQQAPTAIPFASNVQPVPISAVAEDIKPTADERDISDANEEDNHSRKTDSSWRSLALGFVLGCIVGATITSVAICSGGRCTKQQLQTGGSSTSGVVRSPTTACVAEDGMPFYEQVPLNTFQFDENWFHVVGAESAEFPDIDHYGFCVAVCRSEGFDSGAFSTTSVNGPHCACYHSADITCLLRYGENVDANTVASGTLFTPKALSWCTDQDYCDVFPTNRLCFTDLQWNIKKSWPWLGGDWDMHYVDSAAVDSENDCFDYCKEYEGVITITTGVASSPDNCFCFDAPNCMIDWGEKVDTVLAASGTFASKRLVDPCSFDLCDQDPTNSFCYTNNKYSNDVQFEGTLTASTTQDIDYEFACIDFCSGQDAAVYYGDSCECYTDITCVTAGSSTFTSLFTLEPVPTCT